MKYKITIIKYEKNENYEEEMAKWKESTTINYGYIGSAPMKNEPQIEVAKRSLEVFLTEEEYNAIKKSVLETFK